MINGQGSNHTIVGLKAFGSLLDVDKLDQLTGNDSSIRYEAVAAFIDHLPPQLEELKGTVKHKNREQIMKMLHKMKGSIFMLCSDNMQLELLEVEHDVLNGEVNGMDRLPKLIENIHRLILEAKVLQATSGK